ncbi:protein arginine N-methyltransferase 7 isoform X2 [Belonocnema kinseyi]|uniref:protein arginine N-methyltransferase 7 isoform X2 n=1 Tax=Belonocnema kinseyi TaxID=2817044 RepID=UPI00143D5B77|nr:protein arginine N-methyltransferase 7 isoform X2 [Belonocnema kinseyi]
MMFESGSNRDFPNGSDSGYTGILQVSYKINIILRTEHFSFCWNMSIFTQWMNPINGIITWEEKHSDYDYHQEVARSAFADMLHDKERNKKYYAALKAAIDKKHKNGEKANVLDIGTGTGLLSMMAAKCGADSVIACEAFKPMAQCAATIIRENGFEKMIKLIQKRSTNLTVGENGDLPQRANILVTEVFDTELIGEGALSTFHHAHQFLLEESSIVIPSKGTIWVQIIESSTVKAWNKISPIRHKDNKTLFFETNSCMDYCSGTATVHDLQLSCICHDSFTSLLPPVPIFQFDWSGKVPLLFNETSSVRVKPIVTGTAHAVFMWWELQMDTDGEISLSCAPVWEHPNVKAEIKKGVDLAVLVEKIPWRDHWMQAIYYLPMETSLQIDQEVTLIGCHDEYSFWFSMKDDSELEPMDFERPICTCCLHLSHSRTRIGQLNDKSRNNKYLEVLKKKINFNTTCLCLSDGSLLGIMAARLGAKEVIILEPNFLSRKTMEMFVEANYLSKQVQIIDSLENFPIKKKVDIVFGEPSFITSILPWHNLRFWYLSSSYFVGAEKFPISAAIRGVAMDFKDLHKIRSPLGICEGFHLSTFDKFVQDSCEKSDSPVEAQPLWEYFGRALSSTFNLASFDLTKNVNSEYHVSISGSTRFEVDGLCNGIALWMDWKLDEDISICSGPLQPVQAGASVIWDPYTKQGVYLLESAKRIKSVDKLCWTFDFTPKEGLMKFDFCIMDAPKEHSV